MGCTSSAPAPAPAAVVHVVVDRPLCEHASGSAHCIAPTDVTCAWHDASGKEVGHGPRLERATPGAYELRVSGTDGERAAVSVDLSPAFDDVALVTGYRVTPCSGAHARDAVVEAGGYNLDVVGARFLWTSGVITRAPVLRDVGVGTYALTLLPAEGDGDARIPVTVHQCAPAVVAAPSWQL